VWRKGGWQYGSIRTRAVGAVVMAEGGRAEDGREAGVSEVRLGNEVVFSDLPRRGLGRTKTVLR
jgi:hypothetical protein